MDSHDAQLLQFDNYNDYLRSFMRIDDYHYLQRERVIRTIVLFGYRSGTPIYSEVEFEMRKERARDMLLPKGTRKYIPFSINLITADPFLLALGERELPNINKAISTIIFLTYHTKSGFCKSAYIDYESSLRNCIQQRRNSTNWARVFGSKGILKPKPTHLSYYDEFRQYVTKNSSPNYEVIEDLKYGLLFMHKGDHKIISIGPDPTKFGENVARKTIKSPKYGFVILYDHVVRKKV